MAKMGDWRKDKDEEIELDGIGGVNILVKADVHRSGKTHSRMHRTPIFDQLKGLTFHVTPSKTKQRQKDLRKWRKEPVIK